MKMKRGWWYVVVLVLLLIVVFRDNVGLAPKKESVNDADNSILKDVGLVKGDEEYSRTQKSNSEKLVDGLGELGVKNG